MFILVYPDKFKQLRVPIKMALSTQMHIIIILLQYSNILKGCNTRGTRQSGFEFHSLVAKWLWASY